MSNARALTLLILLIAVGGVAFRGAERDLDVVRADSAGPLSAEMAAGPFELGGNQANEREIDAAGPVQCPAGGNDGFEAGVADSNEIPCWTVVDSGLGSWCNQVGTAPPLGDCSGPSPAVVEAPPEGAQAAMTNQSTPGSRVLFRCWTLASDSLSFQLFVNNNNGTGSFFSPESLDHAGDPPFPNQQFRADLVTEDGMLADPFTVDPADILLNIYRTQPGNPAISGYSTVNADVSLFVGQDACLRFAEVDNQLWLHVGIDDVQFGGKSPDGDTDGDGCADLAENGPDETLGGQRDYLSFWDFYDVPTGVGLTRDKSVASEDIFGVIGRFNATDVGPGDFYRDSNPLSTPNPVDNSGTEAAHRQNYHPGYDRTSPVPGADPWDTGPPDGAVASADIFAVLGQFGHSCL